ncbi:hypothetical protein WICMUC_002581 [Wickerhamomyces mucosus]|uniref:Cysteine-rich transmembrane domain-containing protein n=1 Tax=Wickerhamomyces mucosus TaxID=1378264 RepID=A0A9P8TEB3_9ASCO|nr:hypothetical protein WICMUC_002581 [Wickerhamomyces mucosus]
MSAEKYYNVRQNNQQYNAPSGPPPGHFQGNSDRGYYQQPQQNQYYQQPPQQAYYQQQGGYAPPQQGYYQQQQQPVYVQQPPQQNNNSGDCLTICLASLCCCLTMDLLF